MVNLTVTGELSSKLRWN